MERNFARIFYINKENFWSQEPPEGAPGWAQPTRARLPSHARPGGLSPPGGPADPKTDAIKSYFSRKNLGERIIAIHEKEPPSPPVLHWEARSGGRLGLQRGGSLFFVITNPSPSPIPWWSPPGVSNSIVGLLDGDGLDEIYHVIELVLLGFDP